VSVMGTFIYTTEKIDLVRGREDHHTGIQNVRREQVIREFSTFGESKGRECKHLNNWGGEDDRGT